MRFALVALLAFNTLLPATTGKPARAHETGGFTLDLVTLGPIQSITSSWGHTALRFYDPQRKMYLLFDYGRFRFGSDFFLKYLTGKPSFWLGRVHWQRALKRHRRLNRDIYLQRIHLDQATLSHFYQALTRQSLGRERFYNYNHMSNNCTSKVRDLLNQYLHNALQNMFAGPAGKTFRQHTIAYASYSPWFYMGLNLLMNFELDAPMSQFDKMILPLDLMQGLEALRSAGDERIGPVQTLHKSPVRAGDNSPGWILFYCFIFLLLAGFVVTARFRSAVFGAILAGLWYCIGGLVGTLLLITWVISGQPFLQGNINLLGFNALLLVVGLLHLLWHFNLLARRFVFYGFYLLFFCIATGYLLILLGQPYQYSWHYLGFSLMVNLLSYLRLRLPGLSQK